MRKPLVSRTMIVSEVTADIIDLKTEEEYTITDILPRTYKDQRKLEKLVSARLPEGNKLIRISEVKVSRYLLAMNEQEFIDHSHKINGYHVSETGEVFGAPG